MKKHISYLSALAFLLSLPVFSAHAADKASTVATSTKPPAAAYTGVELAKDAKVSITEARTIALKALPGKITDEELEKEKGREGKSNHTDWRKSDLRGTRTHTLCYPGRCPTS